MDETITGVLKMYGPWCAAGVAALFAAVAYQAKRTTLPLNYSLAPNDMLTGYDAPLLYCMYLDKPMRDHVLLQAIARVNEVFETHPPLAVERRGTSGAQAGPVPSAACSGRQGTHQEPDRRPEAGMERLMAAGRRSHSKRRKAWTDKDGLKVRAQEWAEKVGLAVGQIHIRKMTRKWASMTSDAARLTLNSDLVTCKPGFVDYVIVHEPVHTRVPNHGRLFKSLMSVYLPGWENLRELEGA